VGNTGYEPADAAFETLDLACLPPSSLGKDDEIASFLQQFLHLAQAAPVSIRRSPVDPNRIEKKLHEKEQHAVPVKVSSVRDGMRARDQSQGQETKKEEGVEMTVMVGDEDELVEAVQVLAANDVEPEEEPDPGAEQHNVRQDLQDVRYPGSRHVRKYR
jgi:hypothetical protein